MASSSSTSNQDLSKNLDSLSLSEPIDPWSRPLDDDNTTNPALTTNPPTTASKRGITDSAGSDGPPPLPIETPPFASSEPVVQVDQAIIDDFDPLGNKTEQEAKKAWEQSEPHPPVPPKPSPAQPEPTAQDGPTPLPTNTQPLPPPAPIPVPDPVAVPPTVTDKPLPDPNSASSTTQDHARPISQPSTPTFSGLAAIARTFIPKSPVRASRPLSIDQATVISSPTTATFGAYAQDQGASHKRSQSHGLVPAPLNLEVGLNRDENRPLTPGSAPRTPRSTAKDVDKDQPPQFDFQSFLEQIKSKPAEPVAKYLRSCVSNVITPWSDH